MIFFICILIIILVICGIGYCIHCERVEFNNGICPKCGKPLKFFDMDSQGGRGYCCNDCRYYTWVSYNCIDKKYNNQYYGKQN